MTNEQSIEAPLAVDAPVQPELSAWDIDTVALLDDVAAYMHADTLAKREAEAVQHPVPAYGSLRKGDCVRVRTSNKDVPFVGRIDKLTWARAGGVREYRVPDDGRVCHGGGVRE